MAIKLVGLDVDGTLIDEHDNIPDVNLRAIKRAIDEKGVHFAIMSGRISQSAREYQKRLGVKGGPVSSLGGCLLEDEDGTILDEHTIDKFTALTVFTLSQKYNITLLTYLRHRWYHDASGDSKWFQSEKIATNVEGYYIESVPDLIRQHEPNKFLAISENTENLRQFSEQLNELCPGKVKTYLSWPQFLEVIPPKADKGTAILALMKYWGLKKEEVMVVGDFNNDLHMFEQAGVSVAVANAVDEVKQAATYVSPLTNVQGAVADAVEKFILSC